MLSLTLLRRRPRSREPRDPAHLQSLEERELELALREAELNRREAAIRRGEEATIAARKPAARALTPYDVELERELAARLAGVERRERELGQVVEAVEAQRQRLEEVQHEYEERRDALTGRAREVEAELRCEGRACEGAEEALRLAAAAHRRPAGASPWTPGPRRSSPRSRTRSSTRRRRCPAR